VEKGAPKNLGGNFWEKVAPILKGKFNLFQGNGKPKNKVWLFGKG